jgi:hypothetical protein
MALVHGGMEGTHFSPRGSEVGLTAPQFKDWQTGSQVDKRPAAYNVCGKC